MTFDYSLDFKTIDFRRQPELYRTGRGEQGVLSVEPYKSEILQHWRFKTPAEARLSSDKIYEMFLDYKRQNDFVGMDMARKFLQMGWTRSLRYFNHRSGKKYSEGKVLPYDRDYEKLQCSKIFKERLDEVRKDAEYLALKQKHLDNYK